MIKVFVTHKNNKPVEPFFFPVMSLTRGRELAAINDYRGYMCVGETRVEI